MSIATEPSPADAESLGKRVDSLIYGDSRRLGHWRRRIEEWHGECDSARSNGDPQPLPLPCPLERSPSLAEKFAALGVVRDVMVGGDGGPVLLTSPEACLMNARQLLLAKAVESLSSIDTHKMNLWLATVEADLPPVLATKERRKRGRRTVYSAREDKNRQAVVKQCGGDHKMAAASLDIDVTDLDASLKRVRYHAGKAAKPKRSK